MELTLSSFGFISILFVAVSVCEMDLLLGAQSSSHLGKGRTVTTAPPADCHTGNGVVNVSCAHASRPSIRRRTEKRREDPPREPEKQKWNSIGKREDRPVRTKRKGVLQEVGDTSLETGARPYTSEGHKRKSSASMPAEDDRHLPAAIGDQHNKNPTAGTLNGRQEDRKKDKEMGSPPVNSLQHERNSSDPRHLAGGWAGYPAYLSWYRAKYLPWYYGMYGAAATPPLPTSPVVYGLYQASVAAPQAPVAVTPVTAGPAVATPVVATPATAAVYSPVQSLLVKPVTTASPVAAATALQGATSAPTEALLSLQEPVTTATALTAAPLTQSAPAVAPLATGVYEVAPVASILTPAITATEISPPVVSTSATAAPVVLATTPSTLATPASLSIPASTNAPVAVTAPLSRAATRTAVPVSALVGVPAATATLPAGAAVPALLSAPTAVTGLPVTQLTNTSRLPRRTSGGVAGLGLANFAAFLSRPDGTLAAVGGSGT